MEFLGNLSCDVDQAEKESTDEEIKTSIKNSPQNVEVFYDIKSRSFLLYDFSDVFGGCDGVVRYRLTKKKLLELLIEYGEIIE